MRKLFTLLFLFFVTSTVYSTEVTKVYPLSGNPLFYENVPITFTVNISDAIGLDHCEWYIDGDLQADHDLSGNNDQDSWTHTFTETAIPIICCMAYNDNGESDSTSWWVSVIHNGTPHCMVGMPMEPTFSLAPDQPMMFEIVTVDGDGNIDRVEWYLDEQLIHTSLPDFTHRYSLNDTLTLTFDTEGTYELDVYAYDSLGMSQTDGWEIIVQDDSPVVLRDYPVEASVDVNPGEEISFTALASVDEHELCYFDWYLFYTPMARHDATGNEAEDTWSHTFDTEEVTHVYTHVYSEGSTVAITCWEINVEQRPFRIWRENPESRNVQLIPGQVCSFTTGASVETGTLDHFEWYLDDELVANHDAAGDEDEDSWSQTFENEGTYTVYAYVYDGLDNQLMTSWQVTVQNVAPEIWRIDPEQGNVDLLPGQECTFTVGASDDDGNLENFEWYVDDQLVVTHETAGAEDEDSWSHTFETEGTYTIHAYIYDTLEEQVSISWEIHVQNTPPEICRVNPEDESINLFPGQELTFTVSASDLEGNLDCFRWYLNDQLMRTHNATGDEDEDTWALSFMFEGTYFIHAYVFDTLEEQVSLTWEINVQNTSPEIWRIAPEEFASSSGYGCSATFTAGVSDVDGNLDFIQWYLGDQVMATHNVTSDDDVDSWSYTFESEGTFDVHAIVYDSYECSEMIAWEITVQNSNPVIWRVEPEASSTTSGMGRSLSFTVGASDSDSNLVSFEWYLEDELMDQHEAAGARSRDVWSYTFESEGTFDVHTVVYDEEGLDSVVSWEVTVIDYDCFSISLDNQDKYVNVSEGTEITFDIAASSPFGIEEIAWAIDNAVQDTADFSGEDSVESSFTHTFNAKGNYLITATAANSFDESATEFFNVFCYDSPDEANIFYDNFYCNIDNPYSELADHGWHVCNTSDNPGAGGYLYSESNVYITEENEDRVLNLKSTSGTNDNDTYNSMIRTLESPFCRGTYVFKASFQSNDDYTDEFTQNLFAYYDNTVTFQRSILNYEFYSNGFNEIEDNILFIETSGDHFSHIDTSISILDNDYHYFGISYQNNKVRYYIDGNLIYPPYDVTELNLDSDMSIMMSNLIYNRVSDTIENYVTKIDWFYYIEEEFINLDYISDMIDSYRSSSIHYLNSYDDGISDNNHNLPLVYNCSLYPNPFNSSIKIQYDLPKLSTVTIEVYNSLGQKIDTIKNMVREVGRLNVDYSAADLSSGVYFITIRTDTNINESYKAILVK